MRTKFIGLDGYKKIETVSFRKKSAGKKISSFIMSLKKFVKISRTIITESLAERKKAKAKAAPRKAAEAPKLTVVNAKQKRSSKALKHSGAKKPYVLRSKAALGISAVCAAIVMSITATSALSAAPAKQPEPTEPTQPTTVQTVIKDDAAKEVCSELSKSISDEELLTYGWGLYVDGEFLGACTDENELRNALQTVLDNYKAAYDDETTDCFANDVEVEFGSFKSNQLGDAETIVNNNLDKFSISLSTDLEYTEDIPFEKFVEYDENEYTDYRVVTQKGITGKQKTIIRATYIDGVQTDTEITDVITTKEKQDLYIVKGSKEYPVEETSDDIYSDYDAASGGSSSGSFIWPMPYTTNITSGYGARWGTTHTGIDIAAGGIYGQSIIASDGGVVEWAGSDNSGYGTYVIINHGNGYKTLYGHCSELFVSAGESVSQGQPIAAVGSTGFSTGPHLHFEVRTEAGDRLDPQGFV